MDETPNIDFSQIAQEVQVRPEQVENVTSLLDEGNTVPFITRYRKERTGNLDEEQIRNIREKVQFFRQLAERARTILRLIDAQGKLTPELQTEIEQAKTLKRLEDLYLPYRPKRKSRAQKARQRGLEPLAERIWNPDESLTDLEAAAASYVDPAQELPSTKEVLQGAADILAERIGEDAEIRSRSRKTAWKTGRLKVAQGKAAEEAGLEFRDYFDYSESVSKIPPHRILALNRGEKANALRIRFEWDDEKAQSDIADYLQLEPHRFRSFLQSCMADALQRLIQPSLEREIRRELTERAENHAVSVFAKNLKNLLLQPPLKGQNILAVDPGFRTGCKVVVLDEFGNCLTNDVVYITGSDEKKAAGKAKLVELISQHDCRLVAIGNGTACRETEELISELIANETPDVRYVIVNEAGASIYSTSNTARKEFPDYDATVRGTISIGRRLQDPLSELVKIDPQHIGVGMYQHDLNPKVLQESLDQVIESCVNYVGVDLNTASASLLKHVSGMNQLIARRVVEWRDQHGQFRARRQLLDVPGIGDATFTQSAGFLKISGGDEPLDNTWIHPESYETAHQVLQRLSVTPENLGTEETSTSELRSRISELNPQELAKELQVGRPTLTDILDSLARPGRDPRTDLPGPIFKQGVLSLDDLQEGMELTGTVLNVVDFGAFVDIGLKDSALVHISELSPEFVKSPHQMVSVGDIVTVWVLGVDRERRRVSLTMIKPGTPRRDRTAKGRSKSKSRPRQSGGSSQQNESKKAPQKRAPRKPPSRRKPRKRKPTGPPLSQEQLEGDQPLSGFDELKQLWEKRDK